MIPPLDHRGLLPDGQYEAGWEEIARRFATNPLREVRIRDLRQFIRAELVAVASGLDLTLGGSYFSDKPDPGDIDCTLFVPLDQIVQRVPFLTLCNEHGGKGRIWDQYKVELYPSIGTPSARDFRQFFQYVGEKTAALKSLNEKDTRGIIKVESWTLG